MVGSLQSGRHFSNLVDVDGTQRGIGATDAEGCGDAFLIKLKTFYVAYGEPSISSQCFFPEPRALLVEIPGEWIGRSVSPVPHPRSWGFP